MTFPRRQAAALVISGTVLAAALAGCTAKTPQPELADQTGKTYSEAHTVAKAAGYRVIQAKLDTSDRVDLGIPYTMTYEPENLPPAYAAWTVCSTKPDYIDTDSSEEDPGFWSVDFFMVEKKDDCKKGRLAPGLTDRYDAHAEAVKAAKEKIRNQTPSTPAYTPPPSRGTSGGTSGSGGASQDPPLALDLSWLTMSVSDRAYMCSRYRQEPDYIARLLVSQIKDQAVTTAQAHTLFRTNC
ncbi:hypothetical protein ACODT5_28840 [Streptomyces sp. 5.8]|uniref:hypothetical protein n=1 Tax=Streptomyces sp. 5.8 TaxID=3406571 RepID=UPI003BB672E7